MIDIRGIKKEVLLTGLYKFAPTQGIGYQEQLELGAYGKPILQIFEAEIILEDAKNNHDRLYIADLFGKNLFVDISHDFLDPSFYDAHNGPGTAQAVVDCARKNPDFFQQPLSAHEAKVQIYHAYSIIHRPKYYKKIKNQTDERKLKISTGILFQTREGYPITMVGRENKWVKNAMLYKRDKSCEHFAAYNEIAIEFKFYSTIQTELKARLLKTVENDESKLKMLFKAPLIHRNNEIKISDWKNDEETARYFMNYKSTTEIVSLIPTRADPNRDDPMAKIMHEYGLSRTFIGGKEVLYKGEDNILSLLKECEQEYKKDIKRAQEVNQTTTNNNNETPAYKSKTNKSTHKQNKHANFAGMKLGFLNSSTAKANQQKTDPGGPENQVTSLKM